MIFCQSASLSTVRKWMALCYYIALHYLAVILWSSIRLQYRSKRHRDLRSTTRAPSRQEICLTNSLPSDMSSWQTCWISFSLYSLGTWRSGGIRMYGCIDVHKAVPYRPAHVIAIYSSLYLIDIYCLWVMVESLEMVYCITTLHHNGDFCIQ